MVTRAQALFGAVAIYIVIVLAVGLWYGRNVKDEEDYFMAGRRMRWLPTALSYWATVASGGIVLGTVGLFYAQGGKMLGYGFAFAFIFPLLFWMVGDKMRALGVSRHYHSPWEFLADRYDSHVFKIPAGLVSIVTLMAYMAVGGVGVGLLFQTFTGMSYLTAVVIFYAVVVIYIGAGGLSSVMYTDVVQGAISISFFVIAGLVLTLSAGGPIAVFNTGTPVETFGPSPAAMAWYLTWIVFLGFMVVTLPDRAIRYFSIDSRRELKAATLWTTVILVLAVLSFMYLGGALRAVLGTGLENSDQAIIQGLEQAWPMAVVFLTVTVWATSMSTVDSIAIAAAAIINRDIYQGWQRLRGEGSASARNDDDDEMIRSIHELSLTRGRLLIVVVVAASIVFAGTRPPFIWDLIGLAVASFIQFIPPLVGGLYLSKQNKRGAELGWIVGEVLVWGYLLGLFGAAPTVMGIDFNLPWILGATALVINSAIYTIGYAVSTTDAQYDVMIEEIHTYSESD